MFFISATVYAFAGLDAGQLADISRRLSSAVGEPVSIRARVIQATMLEAGVDPSPAMTPGP